MKKFLIGAALAAGVCACEAAENSPAPLSVNGVSGNDTLRMRASESANAAETGQIPANADGVIPGKASSNLNWLSVTYQGKSGFVNTRYLAYGESVGGYRLPEIGRASCRERV